MVWLVTGGNGQLGRALSLQLALEGIDFHALDSNQLDVTNVKQVDDVIGSLKPHVVINTAAWTDVDGAETNKDFAYSVNQAGVKNLALATKRLDSIFIHFSTDYVFSGESNQPWLEDSLLAPQNIYGHSKAAGESVVNKFYSERSYILRTAWLYSEFGKNFAKTMCKIALNTKDSVRVVKDQIGQPTNAQDLASQVILVAQVKPEFGTYHGTNSGQASWFDFAQEIFKLVGADPDRIVGTLSSDYQRIAKRPSWSVLSHERWHTSEIPPMQEWKQALKKSIPAILDSIEMEP